MGNHCMPVPRVVPDVKNTRPLCELITMAVGSMGLTAKLDPGDKGHSPAPVVGLSPGCSRPVTRLMALLPAAVYWKKSEASGLAPAPGHMYWKISPEPV